MSAKRPGPAQAPRPGPEPPAAKAASKVIDNLPQVTLSFTQGASLMPKTQTHNMGAKKGASSVEKVALSDIIVAPANKSKPTIYSQKQISEMKPKLKILPSFTEIPITDHQQMFLQKMEQCSITCNWQAEAPPVAVNDRDLKSKYLKEIVAYVTNGKNVFPESVWHPILKMIQANIFRSLPNQEKNLMGAFDMEEEEPNYDPAWQHLQFIYEILFRFVLSNEVDPKIAIKYFTTDFISNLIDLFDSEDPRERDGLKSTLHRIYSRFWPRRPFIRNTISHKFHRFIFDQISFNGVAELLEILGSIIHGFGVPVKQEHKQFLQFTLLPLHKASRINAFHMQLSNCMILYIEKEPAIAKIIIPSLIKYWPKLNSNKQILFLAELEDMIDSLSLDDLNSLAPVLFKKIAECISSPQFQVAERALSMLSNEYILQLISQTRGQTIPILFMSLYANTKTHWNNSIILSMCHIIQEENRI
ncbi:MAG: putative Serine/threonine-protein phosphatase 2A 56 kDa regulatory subunit delta [Streblomastix strix]|uniref:Putative Serine/threonine-protein phosphatase 2A 56 kDa regulatory subunit delta n=1 Tax=Streblomastix strix TaxID=222440 RepID=A0A5J4VK05_9EUKA|nr:MAG: putative Serine/threonine-protein phosphatase 2A 56 kDa regulatory subunit delta [Streblomastix strix]